MRLILPRRRTKQPIGLPRIDWSNPITKGLVSLVHVGSGKAVDLCSPSLAFTVTGVTRSIGKMGSGYRQASSSSNGIESGRGQYGKANVQFPLTMIHVGETANTDNATISGVGNGINGGICIGGFSLGRIVRFYIGGSSNFITDSGAWNNVRGVFGMTGDGTTAAIWDGGKKIKSQAISGTIQYDLSFGHRQIFGDTQDGNVGATGFCQFDAVWNRVLTDAEMTSLGLHPQQLLAQESASYFVDGGGATNVTGTFASTLDSVTLAASGTTTNSGTFSTALGGCTLAASGSVGSAPIGAFASTLDSVAMASSGAVLNRGTFASTLDGATLAASGSVQSNPTGTFAATLDGVGLYAVESASARKSLKRRRILRRDNTN